MVLLLVIIVCSKTLNISFSYKLKCRTKQIFSIFYPVKKCLIVDTLLTNTGLTILITLSHLFWWGYCACWLTNWCLNHSYFDTGAKDAHGKRSVTMLLSSGQYLKEFCVPSTGISRSQPAVFVTKKEKKSFPCHIVQAIKENMATAAH